MLSGTKWLICSVGVMATLLLAGTEIAKAYQYDFTSDEYEYDDFSPEVHTSTRWEEGSAVPAADKNSGQASASVHTYAWAQGDGAEAEAEADAGCEYDWIWNGPPGTAPGGTLDWSHDGQGYASISGGNSAQFWSNVYLVSQAQASAYSSLYASEASGSWGNGSVSASVSDGLLAQGSASVDSSADAYFTYTYDPEFWGSPSGWTYGAYDQSVEWAVYESDSEPIASGTSHVYAGGGAFCDAASMAIDLSAPSEDASAVAYTYANALVRVSPSFSSN